MPKSIILTDARVASIKPPKTGRVEYPDLKVTGLRLRIGTSGRKVWIVRARAGERMTNQKLGVYPAMGVGAARRAAEKLLEAIAKDGGIDAVNRTFGDAADAWVEKKKADKRRNKSIGLQERRLELHVLPKWKGLKLASIKRGDVRALIEGIEGDVLPNRVLAVIRTVLRHALSRDWMEFSPAEGIDKPRQETERDRFLSMEEAKRVWDAAGLMGYPFGPYARALLLTGQRRTEVASMRWSDIDLNAGTWSMRAADTKGERAHLVPLSPAMVDILETVPRLGDFVFTSDGETFICGFAKGKSRLDNYIAARGAPLEPWTLHDLRRTVGTQMARLGITRDVRARVFNHAMQGVTDRTYNVFDYAADKRSALDRWAAELIRAIECATPCKGVPLHG